MATQNAVLLKEVGKPVVFVDDRPIPQPGPDQIQVKVKVAALNPHDQKTRDIGLGIVTSDKLPWVSASDVAGTVSALGFGADAHYGIGDRVMFFGSHATPGCTAAGMQEYAVTDVGGRCCKVPTCLSDDEAATIPTNLSSVFVALFIMMGIRVPWDTEGPGEVPESLLIVGGGSNCGQFGVQLAKLAGIKVIVAVGGKEDELKALGATHVLDRHASEADIVKQVKEITKDYLLYAFDAVNLPEGLGLGFNSLSSKRKGKLGRLLPRDKLGEELTRGHEYFDVVGGGSSNHPLSTGMWERLPAWLEEGKIKPTSYSVIGGLNANVVNAALDRYRDGTSAGQPHVHVG